MKNISTTHGLYRGKVFHHHKFGESGSVDLVYTALNKVLHLNE